MAKKKNQPTRTKLEEFNDSLSSIEQNFEKHKKVVYWTVGSILLIAAAFFAYNYLVHKPNVEKAKNEIAQADNYMMAQDTVKALKGYQDVAKKYGHNFLFKNGVGNLAKLKAATILYSQNKNDEAQKFLDDYSTKGKVVGPFSQCLMGDTYVNKKQYDEAIKCYDKAIDMSRDSFWDRITWKEIVLYLLAIAALITLVFYARQKEKSKLRTIVLILSAIIMIGSAALATYLLIDHQKKTEENRSSIAYFMIKKAHVLEYQKKYDDALKIYEDIENNYLGPNDITTMDIERVKGKSGK